MDLCGLLQQQTARFAVDGATAALIHGENVQEVAVGYRQRGAQEPLTPATRFSIGCVMKPIVAAWAAHLAASSVIDLDEPITVHAQDPTIRAAAHAITLRHLLSHSSGIDLPVHLCRRLDGDTMGRATRLFPPGRLFSYVPVDYWIASLLLRRRVGNSYLKALHDAVLEPIGLEFIDHQGCALDPAQLTTWPVRFGIPSMQGTARQVAEFGSWFFPHPIAKSPGHDGLKRAAREVPARPVPIHMSPTHVGFAMGALFYRTGGNRVTCIGADGGTKSTNQYCLLATVPSEAISLCVMCDSSIHFSFSYEVARCVLGELAGIDFAPIPELSDERLDNAGLVGLYRNQSLEVAVRTDAGKLRVEETPLCKQEGLKHYDYELIPLRGGYFLDFYGFEVAFIRDPEGTDEVKYVRAGRQIVKRVADASASAPS